MKTQASTCTNIVNLSAEKVNAAVSAALATQNSTTTGSCCTEASEGHAVNMGGGQCERLNVNDMGRPGPQCVRWIAPPGREAALSP